MRAGPEVYFRGKCRTHASGYESRAVHRPSTPLPTVPKNSVKTAFAASAFTAALPAHAALLIDGVAYGIHFEYSPRPGVAALSNGISAFWNRSLYAMVAPNGIGLKDAAWTGYDFTTVVTGSTSRLLFSAFGTSDSRGGSLDDVSVVAVPEPGTLQVFGLGLVILATVAGTRRRRSPGAAMNF